MRAGNSFWPQYNGCDAGNCSAARFQHSHTSTPSVHAIPRVAAVPQCLPGIRPCLARLCSGYNSISYCKMCSSKVLLKLWEQMEFPWCQIWGIWWVINKFKAEAKNCFYGGDSWTAPMWLTFHSTRQWHCPTTGPQKLVAQYCPSAYDPPEKVHWHPPNPTSCYDVFSCHLDDLGHLWRGRTSAFPLLWLLISDFKWRILVWYKLTQILYYEMQDWIHVCALGCQ